jgi:NhaP-type Na+/H+ and K+/H+ antiporter
LTSTALTAGANQTKTITSFTKDYCPGWPVVPVFVVAEATGDTLTAVSAVIQGKDQFGDTISETVAATNSSGTWTGTAVNAFATITSFAVTTTGTTTANDTVILGFVKTYGLGCRLGASADVIAKLFNGAADAGTVSAANSTYVIAGTPDASKELVLCVRPSFYYAG